jgi:hypothetical protein
VDSIDLIKQPAFRKLSDEEYERAKELAVVYLAEHESIANRELRALTQLTYDQAVTFFNKMIADGILTRVGKTTSTRYFARFSRVAVLGTGSHQD